MKQTKKDYWKENYGYDKEPLVSWEEFDKNYFWCERCESYQEGQCICYAR